MAEGSRTQDIAAVVSGASRITCGVCGTPRSTKSSGWTGSLRMHRRAPPLPNPGYLRLDTRRSSPSVPTLRESIGHVHTSIGPESRHRCMG